MPQQLSAILFYASEFLNTPIAHLLGALVIACVCGGIVGVEREMRGKPAGLRTMMMICCGSTLFTMSSAWAVEHSVNRPGGGDSARVIAQIVSGIGFLGAGTIIHSEGLVVGLTTASTIWTLAAIGVLVGLGNWGMAVAAAMFLLLVLSAFDSIEALLQRRKSKRYHLTITYSRPYKECLRELGRIMNQFRAKEFHVLSLSQDGRPLYNRQPDMEKPLQIECELAYPFGHFQVFLSRLHRLPQVKSIEISPVASNAPSARARFEELFDET
jgi:putative Mg2+ transporter-C (MgtC) family protein